MWKERKDNIVCWTTNIESELGNIEFPDHIMYLKWAQKWDS